MRSPSRLHRGSTGVEPRKAPATVEFLAQPVSGSACSTLAPVLVEVFDRSGVLWSGLDVRLTLIRLGKESRGHLVRGSVVQAKTVGGVATFRRLIISAPGPLCAACHARPPASWTRPSSTSTLHAPLSSPGNESSGRINSSGVNKLIRPRVLLDRHGLTPRSGRLVAILRPQTRSSPHYTRPDHGRSAAAFLKSFVSPCVIQKWVNEQSRNERWR